MAFGNTIGNVNTAQTNGQSGSTYQISQTDSKYLIPSGGGGNIDVVNNYSWTMTPKNSAIRKTVPYISMTEYQQTVGQLIASILFFARAVSQGLQTILLSPKSPGDIYQLKYIAEPTGFTYNFPYFNPKKFSRTTDFPYENGQSPFAALSTIAKAAAGFGTKGGLAFIGRAEAFLQTGFGVINSALPGKLGLENPRAWASTTEGNYTFTFDLFNTGTPQDIAQNRDLCYILKYQQSPNRSYVITDPVCIYDVFIPDVVSMPAAFISNLEISNLGNTRLMALPGSSIPRTIPEAYRLTISLQNLFLPSRNIEGALDQGVLTQGVTTPQQVLAIAQQNNIPIPNAIKNTIQGNRTALVNSLQLPQ